MVNVVSGIFTFCVLAVALALLVVPTSVVAVLVGVSDKCHYYYLLGDHTNPERASGSCALIGIIVV